MMTMADCEDSLHTERLLCGEHNCWSVRRSSTDSASGRLTGGFGDQAASDRRVSADATLTVFGLEAGKMRDVSG